MIHALTHHVGLRYVQPMLHVSDDHMAPIHLFSVLSLLIHYNSTGEKQ